MQVLDALAAVLALDEVRDQVHRARPVQRVQGDQVLEAVGLRALQQLAHAARFELEDRRGGRLLEHVVGLRVVQRQCLQRQPERRIERADVGQGQVEDGQRGEPEEVELHQADRLDVVLVELADRRVRSLRAVQGTEVGQLARRNQHAARVHADVAGQALERPRERDQFLEFLVAVDRLGERRLLRQRTVERPGIGRIVRNQLRQRVALRVRQVEHAPGVAHHRLCAQRAEGRDLRDRIVTVLVLDIVDHAISIVLAEVDVEVRHRHALRIEEALEQQLVAQRIEVRDAERIRDQRARAGAAARSHRDAVRLGPVDEVRDDQEVAGEAHLRDRLQFKVQPNGVLGSLAVSLLGVLVQGGEPSLHAFARQRAAVVVQRHAGRRRIVRQAGLAELEFEVAALRDGQGVGERDRHVGEQGRHLGLRLEVLLLGEAARPARIGQCVSLGDADARLVRPEVTLLEELDRMGGDDGQRRLRREHQGRLRLRGVALVPGAVQFEEIAAGEGGRHALRRELRAVDLAGQQQRADVTVPATGQRDQAICVRRPPLPRTTRVAPRPDCDAGSRGTRASAGHTG